LHGRIFFGRIFFGGTRKISCWPVPAREGGFWELMREFLAFLAWLGGRFSVYNVLLISAEYFVNQSSF